METFSKRLKDRRAHKRAKVNLLIDFSDGRRIFSDHLLDISLGGGKLETFSPPKVGEIITLTIPSDPPIKVKAKVKWVQRQKIKYIFGVEFEPLDLSRETILSNFLASVFWSSQDLFIN